MLDFKCSEIHPFNASQVHVDFFRVGARDIKRRDPASRAEMMFGSVRVEGISGEFLPGGQQAEPLARDYPVNISFFGADGAVALGNTPVYRPGNLVSDAPAMTSTAIDWAVLKLIRHEDQSGANWQIQQIRRLRTEQNLRYKIEVPAEAVAAGASEPRLGAAGRSPELGRRVTSLRGA